MTVVLPGLLGAVIGSFLNVVAWRLPRGDSLVRPGSRCPDCAAPVRPWHNVPVLSWLWLRGRCHECEARISSRYPVVELATAALWAGVVLHDGVSGRAALDLLLVTALVPIALIDLDHRIIPNKIIGPAALIGLAVAALVDPGGLPERLIAAVAAGGAFFAVALAYPAGMGMGDVKLAGLLGLYLGAAVAPALAVALVAGTVVGVAIMARRGVREGRKTAVPFGPFLALGGLVGVFAGHPLVHWYLQTFANGG
jgi:leader peptidase (prepilin peptidase)/N-methyltransferase